ncbi:MAG: PQQ-binding-like beta-propeller repeat protein [Planctomycetota bacterium]
MKRWILLLGTLCLTASSACSRPGAAPVEPVPKAAVPEEGLKARLEPMALNTEVQKLLPPHFPIRVDWSLPIEGVSIAKVWVPQDPPDHDALFVLSDRHDLIAIRREDGRALWWIRLDDKPECVPACTPFSVYVVANAHLMNIERSTGKVLWRIRLEFPVNGTLLVDEMKQGEPHFIIPAANGLLHAFFLESYSWPPAHSLAKIEEKGVAFQQYRLVTDWDFPCQGVIQGPVAYREGFVVVGDGTGMVYGLNAARVTRGQPEVVWHEKTREANVAGVVATQHLAMVASQDRNVYAYGLKQGGVAWRNNSGNLFEKTPVLVTDPATERDLLVVQAKKGPLLVLNGENGATLWQMEGDGTIANLDTAPEKKEEERTTLAVFRADGSIEGRAAWSGATLWTIPSGVFSQAAENAVDRRFYTVRGSNVLCALSREK